MMLNSRPPLQKFFFFFVGLIAFYDPKFFFLSFSSAVDWEYNSRKREIVSFSLSVFNFFLGYFNTYITIIQPQKGEDEDSVR